MLKLKAPYQRIWELALPYLNTRSNDLHTKIATRFAIQLLEYEKGDEDIVIPAILLHDTGWSRVSKADQMKAWGPKANTPDITRSHEKASILISREILAHLGYGEEKISEIVDIIDGHDTRPEALSLNDKIVKDADKLSRYDKEMQDTWAVYMKIDDQTEILESLVKKVDLWFFLESSKKLARQQICRD